MLSPQKTTSIEHAVYCLKKGGIIAYPTEAVYGLGCDPLHQQAVERLNAIKGRPLAKGFILIAENWEQVAPWTQPISEHIKTKILASWPGHTTWIFPASESAPDWLCGPNQTIAVRVSNHPVVQALCHQFNHPIISTSANHHREAPIRDLDLLIKTFAGEIDAIVEGALGREKKPSQIYNAVTGALIRS